MESESLGAKFWLVLIGGVLAGIFAMVVIFILWGLAWYAWGGVVAIVVMISGLILVAWGSDRLVQRRRDVEDDDAGLTAPEADTSVQQQAMKDRGRVQA
jgi:LytS/YehU family sensor histidine kinase